MNRVFNKIKLARELLGLSQQEFAENAGVNRSDISKLENGEKKFVDTAIVQYLNKSGFDTNSLFDDKLKLEYLQKKGVVSEPEEKYLKTPKGLPLIPIDAMAGIGNGEKTALLLDCEHYYIPEFHQKADFLIRISGTSMSPKYYNGDVVACKKIPVKTFIQWGKVYVMDTVQGALCKRLFESEKGETYVRVVSDNDKYPPFDMLTKEIRNLAIVIGTIRLE